MSENSELDNKQKVVKSTALWIKILIPVLILIVVIGIYIIKNYDSIKQPKGQNKIAQKNEVIEEDGEVDYLSSEFNLDATQDFDLDQLLSYGLPVVIDFGADSCIPCKEMAPILEELNKELRGKAIVKFVDVWKNSTAAKKFPIRVIPTQFFFDKEGKPYSSEKDIVPLIQYLNKDTNEIVFTAHEGGLTKNDILTVLKELGVE